MGGRIHGLFFPRLVCYCAFDSGFQVECIRQNLSALVCQIEA